MERGDDDVATLDFLLHILGHARLQLLRGMPTAADALEYVIEQEFDARGAARNQWSVVGRAEAAARILAEAAKWLHYHATLHAPLDRGGRDPNP
jgi:hypothetical protein